MISGVSLLFIGLGWAGADGVQVGVFGVLQYAVGVVSALGSV